MYVAPSRLRQSLIASALNDRQQSMDAYRVAERLWAAAAPSLRERLVATDHKLRQRGGQAGDSGYATARPHHR
jgi:hypothetical protein